MWLNCGGLVLRLDVQGEDVAALLSPPEFMCRYAYQSA